MKAPQIAICFVVALSVAIVKGHAATTSGQATFAKSYFQFLVAQQVHNQAEGIAAKLPDTDAKDVRAFSKASYERKLAEVREELNSAAGRKAEGQFQEFVANFTQAEKKGDTDLLVELSKGLDLNPQPANYAAFRIAMTEKILSTDVAEASSYLSEIQTWADLRKNNKNPPPLDIWMNRSVDARSGKKPDAKNRKAPASLADAEAEAPEIADTGEASGSPLDKFSASRDERRARALAEAEAGMEQVAAERQSAEEEYASKKLTAAQAEAENMKQHAQKLASVEKEALEQRKNSWGNRIKSIVGATVSATTGAFAGGIGARAGEEAVDAIFGNH